MKTIKRTFHMYNKMRKVLISNPDKISLGDLIDIDWHYPLINDSQIEFNQQVSGNASLVFRTNHGEIFCINDFNGTQLYQIHFQNSQGKNMRFGGNRNPNNSELPYLYEINFELHATSFTYAWSNGKTFYRNGLKPHVEKYEIDKNENDYLKESYYIFNYKKVFDEDFNAWVDEQGIDRNNITPEDEQLIKMKWE